MESKLNNLAENFTGKFKLDSKLIISAGLVLNAFGIFELIQGNFIVFLVTIGVAFFCDRLVGESIYQRLAEWTKLFTVFAFFTRIYRRKINNLIMILAVVILLLCNIHYTIEKLLIYHKDKESMKVEERLWVKPYSKISLESVEKAQRVTQYFSETYTLIYIGILMAFIHYK